MEYTLKANGTFHAYQELWNFNLQKIEDIQQDIEMAIRQLEDRYSDFELIYNRIIKQMDLLSSIYSSYNAIEGGEYILRLRSVLQSYRSRYTREGLDFNLIQNLLIKIADARSGSFEQFPELYHAEKIIEGRKDAAASSDRITKKYKWITFERNRSWFVSPFTNSIIQKNENYPIESYEEPDFIHVGINNTVLKIKDIFSNFPERGKSPAYYLLLNDSAKNFAANMIGKQIFSDKDIMKPMLRPFENVEANTLTPGRVRLFGINHILLY